MNFNNTESEYKETYDHANSDYPLAVYFVDPDENFLSTVRWHWHEEIEIDIIREGHAIYNLGDEEVVVRTSDAIFIKSNVFHSIKSMGPGCKIISLIFSPSLLFPDSSTYTKSTYLDPINSSNEKYMIFGHHDRIGKALISYLNDVLDYNLTRIFGYELLTKSSLSLLWYTLIKEIPRTTVPVHKNELRELKSTSSDEERIKDALTFISENYFDPITLEEIADSIHISKSECCRLFKRSIGMSPFEYLKRYRILKACEIMLKKKRDDESISDLASNVGFNNASYFNKVFREYMSCTPSEFKKQSKTERRDKLSPFGMSFTHI